mmetsp:Transcript_102384/g.234818  ORF Transcript_102384/g.234818 Transcript_102384/m.234818 type:complete len:130 (-) Transcript_102384:182-571(-)
MPLAGEAGGRVLFHLKKSNGLIYDDRRMQMLLQSVLGTRDSIARVSGGVVPAWWAGSRTGPTPPQPRHPGCCLAADHMDSNASSLPASGWGAADCEDVVADSQIHPQDGSTYMAGYLGVAEALRTAGAW